MNLALSLSLKQRALTNIAITLWSQDDIRYLLSKSALHTLNDECIHWEKVKESIIEKSLKLPLPEILKQNLSDFILRVGSQITAWVDFHYSDYSFVTELPSMFVWTSVGAINNIETAKLLVMGGTVVSDASFALACMYCLEDEIKYCWNTFDLSLHTSKFNCLYFVSYWSDYMDEFKMEKCSSYSKPYEILILESVKSGNEAATRHFFQKVNKKEDNFVMVCAKAVALKLYILEKTRQKFSLEQYSGVMMFLLSEMNAEQQAVMFASYAYAVLMCLLVWPRQSLFLEMIKDKWNFLSKSNYNSLLHCMVSMMKNDRNLHKIFEEFWQQSPDTYKRFITNKGNILRLVFCLYKSGDEKITKFILKYTSFLDRKRIILRVNSAELFEYLIFVEKWNSIEFLIQECSSSWKDLKRIKSSVEAYVTKLQNKDKFIKGYQWDKFFELLNCCIFKYKTKNVQKTMPYISKKRCIKE